MINETRAVDLSYDFAQQHDILATNNENTARDVSVLVADVNALDRLVQHQIGELVDAAQVADESATVP